MPLINHEIFMAHVKAKRVVAFEGNVGGGKTALCYMLYNHMIQDKKFGLRYLVSNGESVWIDKPEWMTVRKNIDGLPQFLDAFILLDEAGLFLKRSTDADQFMAFTRKLNVVLFFASANNMARNITQLNVERLYDLSIFGIPLWVYRWTLRNSKKNEKGIFLWWKPAEIFGIYDTEDMPYDDSGIGQWLESHIKEILDSRPERHRYNENGGAARGSEKGYSEQIRSMENEGRDIEEFVQAAGELADAISLLDANAGKKKR